ncbi:hypothetical protein GCM10010187_31110 [Actinomadura coerulea]|nr:hypothetical protein GCM10010187_31110 [Actinomadura coerulea]
MDSVFSGCAGKTALSLAAEGGARGVPGGSGDVRHTIGAQCEQHHNDLGKPLAAILTSTDMS